MLLLLQYILRLILVFSRFELLLLLFVLITDDVVFIIDEGVLLLFDVVYGLRFSLENNFSFNNGQPDLSLLEKCFLLLLMLMIVYVVVAVL